VVVVLGGIVVGLVVVVIGGIVEGLVVVVIGGDLVTPEVYILLLISWYWIFFSGSIIIPSIESSLTQDISLLYLVSSQ
jgi:hypothetical protein